MTDKSKSSKYIHTVKIVVNLVKIPVVQTFKKQVFTN